MCQQSAVSVAQFCDKNSYSDKIINRKILKRFLRERVSQAVIEGFLSSTLISRAAVENNNKIIQDKKFIHSEK